MIYKQLYGTNWAIASQPKEIYPLWLSLFNHGAIDAELIDFSDSFQYFIIDENKYLKGRSSAFAMNWPYRGYKGKKGGVWPLAKAKAKRELDSFKEERFLPYHSESVDCYNFGNLSKDLSIINDELNYDFSNLDKDISINLLEEET